MPKPLGGKVASTSRVIDLDQFLQDPSQSSAPVSSLGKIEMPHTDRVVVVGLFVDDSRSMENNRPAVMEGLKLAVESFRGARVSDYYLSVRGFRQNYYEGMLRDVKDGSFEAYFPGYDSTPLIRSTKPHLAALREKAGQYRTVGISTTIAMMIMTDGYPQGDTYAPEEFAKDIQDGDYIEGMGIVDPMEGEGAVSRYVNLFRAMGIQKIFTPKSDGAEIRHGFGQFSQSVASIAVA